MIIKAIEIKRDYLREGRESNIFTAVHPTDFTLEGGQLAEIIGRSGSGKTTFVNMLAGLLLPTSGSVMVDEEDLYAMDDAARSALRNRCIGMIPQGQTGLQSLTVLENICAPAVMYPDADTDIEKIRERARMLMQMVGIEDLSHVYSNELSGGELRRLAIARALINDPGIIIADEPTGDLDDETTEMVLILLRKTADEGAAVLMVTHEKEAASYADLIYSMDKGILSL